MEITEADRRGMYLDELDLTFEFGSLKKDKGMHMVDLCSFT
jgi:hypothetical protein